MGIGPNDGTVILCDRPSHNLFAQPGIEPRSSMFLGECDTLCVTLTDKHMNIPYGAITFL